MIDPGLLDRHSTGLNRIWQEDAREISQVTICLQGWSHFWSPSRVSLGPLLFTFYTTWLGCLISGHASPHHLYADDSQLYVSFASGGSAAALDDLQSRLPSVQSWLSTTKLKLNISLEKNCCCLSVEPFQLLLSRNIWRQISLTWPFPHRHQHARCAVDVMELLHQFCC